MAPLVAVFMVTYFGLTAQTLIEWSKKNVVIGKILMGILFIVLAALIWLL